jgi:queuine tRNA-ribosyltransferase
MILANAFHLAVRPGAALVERLGGLHRFMGFEGAILTDSGGFQVFSLRDLRRIDDDGVEFRSPFDGSRHYLGPEDVVAVQEQLGVDVAMVLDECVAAGAGPAEVAAAVDRTTRWAERSRAARTRADQQVFAIVQGGLDPALRARSAASLAEIGSMDMPWEACRSASRDRTLDVAVNACPPSTDRPRYLMGWNTHGWYSSLPWGSTSSIASSDAERPQRDGVRRMDASRSGMPSSRRRGRSGDACAACASFSRAYLRHLFVAGSSLHGS